jgi:hypothetical protein
MYTKAILIFACLGLAGGAGGLIFLAINFELGVWLRVLGFAGVIVGGLAAGLVADSGERDA